MPLVLAPTGFCGMQHANGEIEAAKAAEEAGVPFCLSTMSICSMEQVAKEVSSPFWFQLYMMKDRYVVVVVVVVVEKHTHSLIHIVTQRFHGTIDRSCEKCKLFR